MTMRSVAATYRGLLFVALLAIGSASIGQTASQTCAIHVYPAEKLRSVGEDFDAVHKLDQDLQSYERIAGKPLGWLSPARQLELTGSLDLRGLANLRDATAILHPQPLTRLEAIAPGPHTSGGGCLLEVAIPQIFLERGGLATRSLRLFGVVRLYRDGQLVRGFSGFASSPMAGFRMKSAADLPASTQLVESAYREAVAKLVLASLQKPK